MTQSGIKSRSSKGGTPDNFNEIRFEDKKGAEQVFIHAEKNQDIEVENDETHWVGHDRKKTIDHDENVEVKNNRTEQVGVDESITIGNNRTESVGVNETITVGANRFKTVGANEKVAIKGNRSETISQNDFRQINGNKAEVVLQNVAVSITGKKDSNIMGDISITTPSAINVTATEGVKLLGGTSISGTSDKSIWNSIHDEKFLLFSAKATMLNFEFKGLTMTQSAVKSDTVLFTKQSKKVDNSTINVAIGCTLIDIIEGTIGIRKRVLTILS